MAYKHVMKRPTDTLRKPGEIINKRYAVVQTIGKGATGEVLVVSDREKNNHLLALKYMKISPEAVTAIEHFKSEFETMTHLNHPNIAKVYDFGWDDELEYYFFTSELIDGFDFVNSTKGMDIEQIEVLFVQALRALEYLHGHGIFHFDIKPFNILIQDAQSPSPSAKVIDFGLASTKPPDKLIGTPSYIAPEMIKKETPDGRADLYSLGVLGYMSFARKNPFKGADKEETLENHLKLNPAKPIDVNPSVPAYLSSIIMKLLEKNPEHRYASAAEVIHDINFRSTRFHAIETPATLLSYVPWEGPFVGRKDHVDAYKEWLDTIDERDLGDGSVFWICGEMGAGKSRFLEECKSSAQLLNFKTVVANNLGFKFLDKLDETKFGSVVIIDNLDKQLEFIDAVNILPLQEKLKGLNTVITTSDDADTEKRIKKFIDDAKITNIRKIDLQAFSIKELQDYIKTLTGLKDAPNWVVRSLHTFTGGNPFFITETLKEMVMSGLLFDQGGRWKKSTLEDVGIDLSHLAIPESIKKRLSERYENFDETTKEILFLLSACRTAANIDTMHEIISATLDEKLKGLVDDNLLKYDAGSGEYGFANVVTKRATYMIMPKEIRRSFHDRLNLFLISKGVDDTGREYHIQRGSNHEAAKRALLNEIKSESKDRNHTHVIDLFLERFGSELNEDVFNLTLLKAKKLMALRRLEEAKDIYNSLIKRLPEPDQAPRWHFELHLAIADVNKRERNLEEATSHLKDAKVLTKQLNDQSAALLIENHLAGVDLMMGNIDYAIEKYEKSRKTARKLNSEERLKIGNNDLGHAYLYKGRYEDAIDVLKDDVKLHDKRGDRRELCRTLYSLGESYRYTRKYDKAEEIFNEIIEVAKEARDAANLYRAYNGIGNVLNEEGNYNDSIGYFDRALDLAIHMGEYDAASGIMINTGMIRSNMDDVKKAFDTFQTALAFLERKDFPVSKRELYLCRTHLELGELYRMQKRFVHAEDHLKKALELAKNPQARLFQFWILLTEAKLAKDEDQIGRTKMIIKEAKKLADSSDKKKLFDEVKAYVKH